MNRHEWNEGMNYLDSDIVDEYILKKESAGKMSHNKDLFIRLSVLAACLILAVCAVVFASVMKNYNLPPVPVWENAQFSAQSIAKLFPTTKEGGTTNSYTKVYVPDSKYLYTDILPDEEYIPLYKANTINKELNREEFSAFIDSFLPELADVAGTDVPVYDIKESAFAPEGWLSADLDIDSLSVTAYQTGSYSYVSVYYRTIVLGGKEVKVDQRLSDEEIADSLKPVTEELFKIFGVSFSDIKVVRLYGSSSKNGVENMFIFLYDESAHPLNSFRNKPVSDYILIEFDNFENYKGDTVSGGVLNVSSITYFKERIDISELCTVSEETRLISLKEAEALLYNGYVFGGHSCPLCMKAQSKISFKGYDFVDIEYIFGQPDDSGSQDVIPFYAFYKKIGKSENGNIIYAKTYVAAVEVSGYKEYFESQKANHTK